MPSTAIRLWLSAVITLVFLGGCSAIPGGVAPALKANVESFGSASEIKEFHANKALALKGDPEAQYNLGHSYSELIRDNRGPFNNHPEYLEGLKWYRMAADQGHLKAQAAIGDCYSNGLAVPKDMVEAVKWWRKAADKGLAYAQLQMGVAYSSLFEEGLGKDDVEAARWWRMAAEQGDAEAQFSLGNAHAYGYGVAKDFTLAAKWWRMAADQGHAQAQYALGDAYFRGAGVAKDEAEAYAFYNLACITNVIDRKNFSTLEKSMSPDALFRGQKRSRELRKEIEAKIAAKKVVR